MTVLLDNQSQKILALAAGASTWTQLPTGAYLVPSQTTPGQFYACTRQNCQCEASRHHPETLCKHSRALELFLACLPVRPTVNRLPVTDRED